MLGIVSNGAKKGRTMLQLPMIPLFRKQRPIMYAVLWTNACMQFYDCFGLPATPLFLLDSSLFLLDCELTPAEEKQKPCIVPSRFSYWAPNLPGMAPSKANNNNAACPLGMAPSKANNDIMLPICLQTMIQLAKFKEESIGMQPYPHCLFRRSHLLTTSVNVLHLHLNLATITERLLCFLLNGKI